MKNSFPLSLVGIAILSFSLTGCSGEPFPPYSSGVKFGVREDPILKAPAAKLGDERYDPDRPGVLPVMKLADAFNPEHPYFAGLQKILAPALGKVVDEQAKGAKLTEEGKLKLETTILSQFAKHRKEFDASLDPILRDPTLISAEKRRELEEALEATFGTPAKPSLANVDAKAIQILKLDDQTLETGSTRYRIHCMHCHGVPGDGRGPTARWINPHPRDFREGKFKFQSVSQLETTRPPARADLLRTLRNGLEGTAMPTFGILHDDELEALASYVIFLSLRGRAEMDVIKESFDFNKDGTLDFSAVDENDQQLTVAQAVKRSLQRLVVPDMGRKPSERADWVTAQELSSAIPVENYPDAPDDVAALKASVSRGKQLFTNKPSAEYMKEYRKRLPDAEITKARKKALADKGDKASKEELEKATEVILAERVKTIVGTPNCVSCHTDYGRQAKFRFDEWGTLVRPNNFTAGIFRGGRRPVDIYYRIHSGINGVGMPNFGAVLQSRDIWDLVNFVSSLPYPGMREKLGINLD